MKWPKIYKIDYDNPPKHSLVYRAYDIDPLLYELERLKKLSDRLDNLRNWIIENTEDVTGQDGVKWNCIERDELLNYLKGQDNE